MRKPSEIMIRPQDRGFYMILLLCIAAVAIAAYVLFADTTAEEPLTVQNSITAEQQTEASDRVPAMKTDTPEETEEETEEEDTEPASNPTEQPLVYTAPMAGEVLHHYSNDTLTYDKTMADWRVHQAMDYVGEAGDEVKAIGSGTVLDTGTDSWYGTFVKIRHSDGNISCYAGLKDVKVGKNDTVSGGDVIATLGDPMPAESADGVHLHLEVTDSEGKLLDAQSLFAGAETDSEE